jgi:hypothetical protein
MKRTILFHQALRSIFSTAAILYLLLSHLTREFQSRRGTKNFINICFFFIAFVKLRVYEELMGYSNRSNTGNRRCRNLITISRCCCRCSKETGLLTSISGFLNTNGNRLFFRTIPLQSYSRIFSSPTQQSALFKHSGQRFNSLVVGSEHPHNGHSFLVVFSFLRSNISFFGNISR